MSMKPLVHIIYIALIIITTVSLQACSDNTPNAPKAETQATEFSNYHNNGLSLSHPAHWKLQFDESPTLYADRGINFNLSEVSSVKVYISQRENEETKPLMDILMKGLSLDKSDGISDLKREPIQIGDYQGERLTWSEKSFGVSNYDITLVKVLKSPQTVFVLFSLIDEDIAREQKYQGTFLSSIKFK